MTFARGGIANIFLVDPQTHVDDLDELANGNYLKSSQNMHGTWTELRRDEAWL